MEENLKAAQATQKAWYDRHSRDRAFNPGDKVLVLLPTSTNRLLASWRGPYPVVRRVSPVNYEVEMADRRKMKGIFHINMLQLWHPPCALSLLAEETPGETDGEIDDDVVLWNSGAEVAGTPTINLQASWRSYAHSFPNSRTCYKTSLGEPMLLNIASGRKPHQFDCLLTAYNTLTVTL